MRANLRGHSTLAFDHRLNWRVIRLSIGACAQVPLIISLVTLLTVNLPVSRFTEIKILHQNTSEYSHFFFCIISDVINGSYERRALGQQQTHTGN